MQTQEEFTQYYLSQTRHPSEFLRSGIVHDESSIYLKSDEPSENGGVTGGLDYRDKGYVTSVS